MRDLFLIETTGCVSLLKSIRGERSEGYCASFDELVIRELKTAGISAVWLGNFSNAQELAQADDVAVSAARGWHEGQTHWSYRGVNLASLVELALGPYLMRALEYLTCADNFLKVHSFRQVTVLRKIPERPVSSLNWMPSEAIAEALFKMLGCNVQVKTVQKIDKPAVHFNFKIAAKKTMEFLTKIFSHFETSGGATLSQKTILICSALHHIQNLAPLVARKNRVIYLDESFQGSKLNFLHRHQIFYMPMPWLDHKLCQESQEKRNFVQRLRVEWPGIMDLLKQSKDWQWRGVPIFCLAELKLRFFADIKVPELLDRIDIFFDVLSRWNIQAVVVDEDVIEFRKGLVSVARLLGIPSLVVLHASTPSFCKGLDLAPLTADYLAVGGEGIKHDCVQWGISPEKIVVSGIPRYDGLKKMNSHRSRKEIERTLGISSKKELVVFAATYIADHLETRGSWTDIERAYRDFFEVMSRFPDKQILVKLYPMDPNPSWVRRIAEESGVFDVLFAGDCDLPTVLAGADYALSFYSSAVTEAFVLGKWTVVMDYLSRLSPIEPLSHYPGSVFTVKNKAQLETLLHGFFDRDENILRAAEQARAELTFAWAGRCDGRASLRVSDFLDRMVTNPKELQAA